MIDQFNLKEGGSMFRAQARIEGLKPATDLRRLCLYLHVNVDLVRLLEPIGSMKHRVKQIHEHPQLLGIGQEKTDNRQGSDDEQPLAHG
jgi:hypothetical protein